MTATNCVDRVGWLPELWYVPATLADLECRHGNLWPCDACEREAEQQALEAEVAAEVAT